MLQILHIKTSDIMGFEHEEFQETVVIMPSIRVSQARRAARLIAGRTEKPGVLVIAEDDCRLGFIATANMVHAKTRSRYAAYVAQDAYAGFYWLEIATETMEKSGAGLLAFNDGRFFGELAAFGLVRREWASTLYGNLLFYPHYKKGYADTELTDIARHTGMIAYNPHSMMIEVDFDRHAADTQGIRYTAPGAEDPDGVLYVQRALKGFDGKTEPFVPKLGPVSAVLAAEG